ncbi:MAG: NADPH-dependent glutamate synthase [Kosmotogaceae bacterium]
MALNDDRTEMREQVPQERIKNFDEVALGYTEEEAIKEAKRCMQCKTSNCMNGCPVGIDIPAMIREISRENFKEALRILKSQNNLPAISGRVCPQETQCEKTCLLNNIKGKKPVAIGRLERFLGDLDIDEDEPELKEKKDKKIAVIGAGPAGLTVSGDLAKMGYEVTVYEAFNKSGGVLIYGIPNFRLPKKVVEKEVSYVESFGVKFVYNQIIGRTIPFDYLKEKYDAIFIGIGAGAPRFLGIEGSNCNNIYSASEFLTRVNLLKANEFPRYDTPIKIFDRVAVIGAGNVSMDSARVAKRLGAKKVMIVYRRSEEQMPARYEEYQHAIEEGVEFHWLTQPLKYEGDINNNVKSMKCMKMGLGEPDDSGRRRPIPVEGSEFTLAVDMVIEAIGQKANSVLKTGFEGLKLNRWSCIEVDKDTTKTNLEGVYAGGDIVTGSATVIEAMGAGKIAAKAIDEYLNN